MDVAYRGPEAAFILIYSIKYQREESEEGEGGGLLGSTRGLADDGKRLDFLSPRGPLHTECQRQLLHPKSLNEVWMGEGWYRIGRDLRAGGCLF